MKINIKNDLYKRIISLLCSGICLDLMALKVFKYNVTSSYRNTIVSTGEGVSLYNFLFNKNLFLLDYKVGEIQNLLKFSYVIVWISFVLSVLSLIILIIGLILKKNLFCKIGSILLVSSMMILILTNFSSKTSYITTRNLNVYTVAYLIALLVSIASLFSTLSLKKK